MPALLFNRSVDSEISRSDEVAGRVEISHLHERH
jgi:hypothetical protein